jgi:hypothetical protein
VGPVDGHDASGTLGAGADERHTRAWGRTAASRRSAHARGGQPRAEVEHRFGVDL